MAVPASASRRHTHPLPGSTPRWLHRARNLGATPAANQVNFGVLLGMRNQANAAATLQAISDPTSASYGHWLSNAAFDARYAPATASVTAVQGWLRSQGFHITTTLPSGMYVEASGSVAQVEQHLRDQGEQLLLPGQDGAGELHRADPAHRHPGRGQQRDRRRDRHRPGLHPEAARRHPARTAARRPVRGAAVLGVLRRRRPPHDKPAAYGKHQPYVVCGYVPQQYQSAYGETALLRSGVTGRGVTVAITDAYAAPTIYQDAQKYNRVHHQPLFTARPVLPDHPGAERLRPGRRVRRAGLVRRGNPRRRGRARDGTRRQDRLRRGIGLRQRAGQCLGQRDRQPRRRRDHQLLDRRHRRHHPAGLRLRGRSTSSSPWRRR